MQDLDIRTVYVAVFALVQLVRVSGPSSAQHSRSLNALHDALQYNLARLAQGLKRRKRATYAYDRDSMCAHQQL